MVSYNFFSQFTITNCLVFKIFVTLAFSKTLKNITYICISHLIRLRNMTNWLKYLSNLLVFHRECTDIKEMCLIDTKSMPYIECDWNIFNKDLVPLSVSQIQQRWIWGCRAEPKSLCRHKVNCSGAAVRKATYMTKPIPLFHFSPWWNNYNTCLS